MAPPYPYPVIVHAYGSPGKGNLAYEQAQHLESVGAGYSVFEIRMRSSFGGFGYSSLENDSEDIASLVRYLRGIGKQKIVLIGHSTGSQDCMEYAKNTEDPVDGFVLQGPVSDRQIIEQTLDEDDLRDSLDSAADMIADDRGHEMMTPEQVYHFYDPISAYRWHSLASKGGDDDYFSSDLDQAKVDEFWGRFKQPALVLYSEKEEHAPKGVEIGPLIESWKKAGPKVHPSSGLIPGANHTVKDPAAQQWLSETVAKFVAEI